MCDDVRALPRPRWGGLYLTAAFTVAALVAVEVSPLAGLVRGLAEVGVLAVAFTAMLGWVHANRVALTEGEWRSCAAAPQVRVRIVTARREIRPLGSTLVRPVPDRDRSGRGAEASLTARP